MISPTSGTSGQSEEMSSAAKAYQEEIIDGALPKFVSRSKEVGGIVEHHVSPLHLPVERC